MSIYLILFSILLSNPAPSFTTGIEKQDFRKMEDLYQIYDALNVRGQLEIRKNCKCQSFVITVVPKNGNPVRTKNKGTAKFGKTAARLIRNANQGDLFYFDDVRMLCSHKNGKDNIPSMTVEIQ